MSQGGFLGLFGFEWDRTLEVLELLAGQADSHRTECNPYLSGVVDRHGMRPEDTHVIGAGRSSVAGR